jgi:hypothetical protein
MHRKEGETGTALSKLTLLTKGSLEQKAGFSRTTSM